MSLCLLIFFQEQSSFTEHIINFRRLFSRLENRLLY
jgi:hypothetical protein